MGSFLVGSWGWPERGGDDGSEDDHVLGYLGGCGTQEVVHLGSVADNDCKDGEEYDGKGVSLMTLAMVMQRGMVIMRDGRDGNADDEGE